MTALAQRSRETSFRIIAGLALATGLIASFYAFKTWNGFWEDEIFQVAFLNEGWPHFLIQIARLDQHPPTHFVQLKLWALFFSSDRGLLLNSLAWHLLACFVIYRVGRAWLGVSTGLLAAALFALVPQVLTASVQLRMYAMIPALAVIVWWLNVKLLSRQDGRWWPWLALVASELALGYSHAIAFYFVAWIALAAFVQVLTQDRAALVWKRWLMIQSGAALLLLPLLLAAVVRISMPGQAEGGAGNSDAGGVIQHFGGMVAGWGMPAGLGRTLGALFFIAAIVLGVWRGKTRALALVLLVGPYALAAVVALFLAPMFKTPVYSAMLLPFACLALAGALMSLKGAWGQVPATALLLGMAAVIIPVSQQLTTRISPYRPIVAALQERLKPGDVVIVPKTYLYWAIMRYAVGPDWGSALEVMPALNPNWQRLIGKIRPDIAHSLKLYPRTDHVVHQGVTYVIGEDARRDSAAAQRVWLIQRPRYPMPPMLADGFVERGTVAQFGDRELTQLTLFERSQAHD